MLLYSLSALQRLQRLMSWQDNTWKNQKVSDESNSHFSLMRKFRLFQTSARISPASIKTQQVIMTLKRQLEIVTSTKEMRLMLGTWLRQGGSEKCHEWERKAAYESSLDLETAQGMTAAAVHQQLDTGKCSHELRTWHFSVVVREKISKRWKKVQLLKYPDCWNIATCGLARCLQLEKLHLVLQFRNLKGFQFLDLQILTPLFPLQLCIFIVIINTFTVLSILEVKSKLQACWFVGTTQGTLLSLKGQNKQGMTCFWPTKEIWKKRH